MEKRSSVKKVVIILVASVIVCLNFVFLLMTFKPLPHLMGKAVMYPALLLSYDAQQDTAQMQIKLPGNAELNDRIYTVSVGQSGGIDVNATLPFRQKNDPSSLRYPYLVYIYAESYPSQDASQTIAVKYIESATT